MSWLILFVPLALSQDLLADDEDADFVQMDLSEPEPALDPAQLRLLELGPRYRALNLHVFTGFRVTETRYDLLAGTTRLIVTDYFQPEPDPEWVRPDGELKKRAVEPLVRVFDSAHRQFDARELHARVPAAPAWSGKKRDLFDYQLTIEELRALVAAHNLAAAEQVGLTAAEAAAQDQITTWPDPIQLSGGSAVGTPTD